MKILITGATGTLGCAIVPLLYREHDVYLLVRDINKARTLFPQVNFLQGDVTLFELGLKNIPFSFDRIYHMAAIIDLGRSKQNEIWKVNSDGTYNALSFAHENKTKHFYLVSTAYTHGRNHYELSKKKGEDTADIFNKIHHLKLTVYKPSIMIGDGAPFGAFHQFVGLMVQVHKRAEMVRRKIERVLHLPFLEPVFRIKGKGEAKLNLIPVKQVARAIVDMPDEGVFYLTNPNSPTLNQLADWVGELLMLKIKFQERFPHTPIEAIFERLAKPFLPYLNNGDLPSDLKECSPVVDKGYIHESLGRYIMGI